MSVCLSARINAAANGGILVKCDIGDFKKSFVKIKMCLQSFIMLTAVLNTLCVHNRAEGTRPCSAMTTPKDFVLFTVTSRSRSTTIKKERIVGFPQRQLLRERAAMLCYTLPAYLPLF